MGDPARVFISYAHDDAAHEQAVKKLWRLLRTHGVDARLDLPAADRPQDWLLWMHREIRDADRILVVASPEYKRRAEGDAGPGQGAGVQFEALLLRDLVYADPEAARLRVLGVVLPGRNAGELPVWLGGSPATRYVVTDFDLAGAESLIRYLTDAPRVVVPALGPVPHLPLDPLDAGPPPVPAAAGTRDRLDLRELAELRAVMLAVPELRKHGTRLAVVEHLPTEVGAGVSESNDAHSHLLSLIQRCERVSGGRAALAPALELVVPPSDELTALIAHLARIGWSATG